MDLFTPEQLATLRAAVDRIIPPDEDPGGWEAGVGDYLVRQLTHGDLQAQVALYREGLNALDTEAQTIFNQPFAAVEPQQQDELLLLLEKGVIRTLWSVNPTIFFAVLADHCAEGYYSDPNNGGNHNSVSWKMIQFEVRG